MISCRDSAVTYRLNTKSRFPDLASRYGFGLLCVALATWVRWQLHPALGDRLPFGTYFAAVLACAWIAGPGPAVMGLVISIVAAAHFFVDPDNPFLISDSADLLSVLVFGLVGIVSIVLFHRLDSEKRLAELRSSEIESLNQKLIAADQAKDEFISLLAHELRNPIAPLQSAAELLGDEVGIAEHLPHIRDLFKRHLTHVRRLIDDLFDVSRYINGSLRLHCEVVDICEPVRNAVEIVASEMAHKQHQFRILLPEERIVSHLDPIRITQICCNLLGNAVKYTPHGGQITLIVEQSGTEIQIHVRDSGVGIANEMVEAIFEPFNQIVSGKARLNGGLGIGLTIVRKLVELHGGTVRVVSQGLGCGSCFTVNLPMRSNLLVDTSESPQACATPPSPVAAAKKGAQDVPTTAAKGSILIADDNFDAADSLRILFQRAGYRVEMCGDGVTAVQTATSALPNFLLLDIGLPDIDGYEVAQRIRQRLHGHPMCIVAITGWGSAEHRLLSEQAGIDYHLVKPVIFTEVQRVFAEWTSHAALDTVGMHSVN